MYLLGQKETIRVNEEMSVTEIYEKIDSKYRSSVNLLLTFSAFILTAMIALVALVSFQVPKSLQDGIDSMSDELVQLDDDQQLLRKQQQNLQSILFLLSGELGLDEGILIDIVNVEDDPEQRIRLYTELLEKDSENPRLLFSRAREYIELGKPEQALTDLMKTVDLGERYYRTTEVKIPGAPEGYNFYILPSEIPESYEVTGNTKLRTDFSSPPWQYTLAIDACNLLIVYGNSAQVTKYMEILSEYTQAIQDIQDGNYIHVLDREMYGGESWIDSDGTGGFTE